ncbi:uncharacterized protein LOC105665032 [Ceratitis capitata]|uniref:uncharacterized protein LOC105665032 n=1 Tax=Ceratitis capitata TaxID=7213 RepID=UPI000618962C|nr:uncharacterized protein LOC105665032 [Ceratitis capitata]
MPEKCLDFAKGNQRENSIGVSSSDSANSVYNCKQGTTVSRSNCIPTKSPEQINFKSNHYKPKVDSESRRHSVDSASSIFETKTGCCCPNHSEVSRLCWKTKRKQLIRESSHASGLTINGM